MSGCSFCHLFTSSVARRTPILYPGGPVRDIATYVAPSGRACRRTLGHAGANAALTRISMGCQGERPMIYITQLQSWFRASAVH